MQNFIVDTLILRHEHRRIREKLNQTQYRNMVIFEMPKSSLCFSLYPNLKTCPPKWKWHYEFAPFNRICDGRSCAASNAGANLRFTTKRIVLICQLKKRNKKNKLLRSAQPRIILDPFANMCEQDADDPVKYRGFHPAYSPGSRDHWATHLLLMVYAFFCQKLTSWGFNDQPCECADVGQC